MGFSLFAIVTSKIVYPIDFSKTPNLGRWALLEPGKMPLSTSGKLLSRRTEWICRTPVLSPRSRRDGASTGSPKSHCVKADPEPSLLLVLARGLVTNTVLTIAGRMPDVRPLHSERFHQTVGRAAGGVGPRTLQGQV